ncbi:MAG: dihydropteroate synthase [Synergistaceae bacterium]|nr:dihydropteroate synthase [Synergistaceae bacterium]
MGILNVNDDSFYAGSRVAGTDAAVSAAIAMVRDGADIIDIGAESTRPGSKGLSQDEEMESLIPVVSEVRQVLPAVPISVDTRKALVAREVLAHGADIINDVSGLGLPEEAENMKRIIAESGAAYVLTHTKGTPENMQIAPHYDDFLADLAFFFEDGIAGLAAAGIARDRIIADPGVGFGKRLADNLDIMANLNEMRSFGLPVLIGVSRKGFIGRMLGLPDPAERLEGTLAISVICAYNGVEIIRVHDVLQNRRAVDMADAIRRRVHE